MLPSIHRMRKPQDFQRTRRSGRKFVVPGLIIHISQGVFGTDPVRIGITVGKDCGNSVSRHRISRRIRAAVRPWIDELPLGSAVVIKALPSCGENIDISAVLTEVMSKVSLSSPAMNGAD